MDSRELPGSVKAHSFEEWWDSHHDEYSISARKENPKKSFFDKISDIVNPATPTKDPMNYSDAEVIQVLKEYLRYVIRKNRYRSAADFTDSHLRKLARMLKIFSDLDC